MTDEELEVQEPTQEEKPKNVFKNRNFSLVFLGALVSNVAALFYSFAVSFYILKITGNNALIQGLYLATGGVKLYASSHITWKYFLKLYLLKKDRTHGKRVNACIARPPKTVFPRMLS